MELQLDQSIQVKLTPSMRASLHTLQLPICELEKYLMQMTDENPMLDYIPPQDFTISPQPQEEVPCSYDENTWNDTHSAFQSPEKSAHDFSDYTLDSQWESPTFAEHIIQQLTQERLVPPAYLPLCTFIVESLDSRGYFTEDLEQIANLISVPYSDMEQALYMVQEMNPVGVGARNLRECLLLQLVQTPYLCEQTLTLISQDWHNFTPIDFSWMAKLLGTSVDDAKFYWNIVSNLNPIPSRGYSSGQQTGYIIPEATIERQGTRFIPHFHHNQAPSVTINSTYQAMMESGSDAQLTTFLRPFFTEAEQVCYSLKRRQNTLESLISYTVQQQQAFFSQGLVALVPLTINQAAQALDVHPSTVSRALRDKYLATPQGVVPLKALFSAHVATHSNSENTISRSSVHSRIRLLISGEDPKKPLSDAKIQKLLQSFQIDISRRAVTKYRIEMGIPSSTDRKCT